MKRRTFIGGLLASVAALLFPRRSKADEGAEVSLPVSEGPGPLYIESIDREAGVMTMNTRIPVIADPNLRNGEWYFISEPVNFRAGEKIWLDLETGQITKEQ